MNRSVSLITTTEGASPKSEVRTDTPLFDVQIYLLRLCDLLQQAPNHDPVVALDVTWGDFDVKVALGDIYGKFGL